MSAGESRHASDKKTEMNAEKFTAYGFLKRRFRLQVPQ
jgi:hypothetical protein